MENVQKYTHITSNNVDGFRYGEWAKLVGIVKIRGRDCYHVQFEDAKEQLPNVDYWPVIDSWDSYKFKRVE